MLVDKKMSSKMSAAIEWWEGEDVLLICTQCCKRIGKQLNWMKSARVEGFRGAQFFHSFYLVLAALKSGPLYRAEERRERWEIIRTSRSIQTTRVVFCFRIVRSRCKERWWVGWFGCDPIMRLFLPRHSTKVRSKSCAPLRTFPRGLKNKSDALHLHSCEANRIQRLVLHLSSWLTASFSIYKMIHYIFTSRRWLHLKWEVKEKDAAYSPCSE